uniref:DNA-directed RNA polymerase III subunit RPC10 n=1 Tax=Leersia perrieri TaxID=77586 RepID=A0A0D9VJD6_9ORYZ
MGLHSVRHPASQALPGALKIPSSNGLKHNGPLLSEGLAATHPKEFSTGAGAAEGAGEGEAAMEFCPACGMLLQIQPATGGNRLRFYCPTCPYVCPIVRKAKLVKKEVEPIFSGAAAMKSASKTAAACPRCNNGEAYFKQMQIRSADEPMTTFFMCCKEDCQFEWRED